MRFNHKPCKRRPQANLHLLDRLHQLLRTQHMFTWMSRGQEQMEQLSAPVWVRFYRCSRITDTDFWCFCDYRRGKEPRICWQHTEMQFRANEDTLLTGKYCYALLYGLHMKQHRIASTLQYRTPDCRKQCSGSRLTSVDEVQRALHCAIDAQTCNCPRTVSSQKHI